MFYLVVELIATQDFPTRQNTTKHSQCGHTGTAYIMQEKGIESTPPLWNQSDQGPE
jgi:hypothetical protein